MSTTTTKPLRVALTVDMEPDCPPFLWTWRGVTEGAPRLLDLFERQAIPVTWFTTGDTARLHPQSVEAIVKAGHELGCHGISHQRFDWMSRESAAHEIVESTRRLREFAPVTSFRAPYLRFPGHYLDLLEAEGFALDSSQAKYKRDVPGVENARNLVRVPASITSSALRIPKIIREFFLGRLADPVVLFVHPWEFVDFTRTTLRYDCRFRTGQPALDALGSVIGFFKARGAEFTTMRDLGVAGATADQAAAGNTAAKAGAMTDARR
ncbi:polysaccharide deacetylase family protein [Phreatobacter stygius]|uniref:Chitooligosaccharide deacetylase n=1 Tax=Phreatobacter stygius TaxID=1940610 RepID=A0A4D7B6Q5_9HYPH|nr:polysaccharide deacetylase family protein [Phreatobacter stygius]QCI66058.1 polysaccharide deacetylase [Phreatobacter stygius]